MASIPDRLGMEEYVDNFLAEVCALILIVLQLHTNILFELFEYQECSDLILSILYSYLSERQHSLSKLLIFLHITT